jgi:hypothetical protein
MFTGKSLVEGKKKFFTLIGRSQPTKFPGSKSGLYQQLI